MATNEHLTKTDVAAFRRLLVEKQRRLLDDLAGLKQQLLEEHEAETPGGGLSDIPTHLAELGTDAFEREFLQKLVQDKEERLHEIDEALNRTDDGTYGACMAEGRTISKQRLRTMPWAKYCADCARRFEYV